MPITLSFAPLQEKDLDQLVTWLGQPHVKAWWDDQLTAEQIKEKYRQRIGDKVVVSFIVYLNDIPIGIIQYYPKFLRWTGSSVRFSGPMARRDDDATCTVVRRSNAASGSEKRAIEPVALSLSW